MSHEVDWNQGLGKRFRPDGTYAYVARWSDRAGQKRTETLPDGTSYQEAKALRAERVRESRLGFAHGSETLDEFVRGTFWPLKERKVRPYTLYTMQKAYGREIQPTFGRLRLRDIRASHVQAWVDRSGLGSATLRKHLSLLSQVLKAAAVRDLAQPVDFSSLELPGIPGRDYKILTLQEVYQLAGRMPVWYQPDIVFLAITGLRHSEYRGLRDDDVDLRGRKVTVERMVDRHGNTLPTKTKAGKRVIDLHEPAAQAYKQRLEQRLYGGLSRGVAFPDPRGGIVHHGAFYSRIWRPAVLELGWPTLRIHDLRHTAASLMARHGATAEYVMSQLGHANTTITLNTYTHLFEEQAREINDRINQAYGEGR